ncbi:MFS transporter [Streptomyces sp. 3MP-14]|uniref:MFS transporter n=1 Tax=Streptomyces mimosae TaxID=2586635 RepID=A0A5N6AEB6_9ACTN|nr:MULTISPECIES: MFS transporter [Streptomyces]KAB8166522.1 MFS transporter [Streptomyces mimosae]KAB8178951.1 MFS transporter [Streptomyces sp. 3MP-14]
MPKAVVDPVLRRWRAALFMLFLTPGFALASWVTRTPAIKEAVDVSTAGMGLILFGLSIGSMIGVLSSGALVARHGGRWVAVLGGSSITLGLAVLACGAAGGIGPVVFLGLAFFGCGTGLQEIAVNVEGAAVERALGRPVMPALHGCFSGGTVLGAGAGIGLTALDFPVFWHLALVTVLAAAGLLWARTRVPGGTGREEPGENGERTGRARERLAVWRERRVVLLGLIVLGMALAEGSANDWLPLIMVDGFDLDEVAGSVVFTVFAAAMTVGRFSGQVLLTRFGRVAVMRGGAVLACLGVLGVITAPGPELAAGAVLLWGLGASLGFPVAISAAGDDPRGAAARVSAVATTGYFAFLVGPPALGFLGEEFGLRNAMVAVLAVVLVAGAVAGAVRPSGRSAPVAEGQERGGRAVPEAGPHDRTGGPHDEAAKPNDEAAEPRR